MSADLVWELVRPWNCHRIKGSHPKRLFTCEKGSLTGRVSSTDSGLANRKAIHVEIDENGIPEMSLKNADEKALRNPDKMWKTVSLRGGIRKAISKADKVLTTYHPQAKKNALRKISLLARGQARKSSGINHKNVKSGRTSRHS